MNIIDDIKFKKESFIIGFGLNPKVVYLGQNQKILLDKWAKELVDLGAQISNTHEIFGMEIIYVQNESYLGFGL